MYKNSTYSVMLSATVLKVGYRKPRNIFTRGAVHWALPLFGENPECSWACSEKLKSINISRAVSYTELITAAGLTRQVNSIGCHADA